MKTLVNKHNPQIRITAPEIEENQYQYTVNVGKLQPLIFLLPEWTLIEEESEEDLEKAAEEYADKHGFRVPYDGSNNFYDDVDVKASLDGFKAGAKWMAEQIKGGSK